MIEIIGKTGKSNIVEAMQSYFKVPVITIGKSNLPVFVGGTMCLNYRIESENSEEVLSALKELVPLLLEGSKVEPRNIYDVLPPYLLIYTNSSNEILKTDIWREYRENDKMIFLHR